MKSRRELVPLVCLNAHDEPVAAAAIGPEDRRFAFAYVEPILAEGVHDIGLVRYDDDVAARGRRSTRKLAQCRGTAIVLDRRYHQTAFRDVSRGRDLAEAEQHAGVDGALERA